MTLEELEKRVRALEKVEEKVKTLQDIEEIKNLMRHYVNCLVFVKWDDLVDCFTENARVDIGVAGLRTGKAAVAKLFKEEIGTRHVGKEWVFVVHPIISVDGDEAKGSWLLYFMFSEGEHVQTQSWVQGPYECEYERENAKWKISYLKWRQTLGPAPTKLLEIYGDKGKKH